MASNSAFCSPSFSIDEVTIENDCSKCCICLLTYNSTDRAPVTIHCGHTFCHTCVRHLTSQRYFACALCQAVSVIGWGGLNKNFAMIHLLKKLNLLAHDDTNTPSDSSPLNRDMSTVKRLILDVNPRELMDFMIACLKLLGHFMKHRYGIECRNLDKIADAIVAVNDMMNFVNVHGLNDLSMLEDEFEGVAVAPYEEGSENAEVLVNEEVNDYVEFLQDDEGMDAWANEEDLDDAEYWLDEEGDSWLTDETDEHLDSLQNDEYLNVLQIGDDDTLEPVRLIRVFSALSQNGPPLSQSIFNLFNEFEGIYILDNEHGRRFLRVFKSQFLAENNRRNEASNIEKTNDNEFESHDSGEYSDN